MSDRHTSQPAAMAPDEISALNASLDRRFANERKLYGMGSNNYFNGSTKFVNTMLTVLALLVASAICGEVVVYGQVQVLQATVNMLVDGRITSHERSIQH
jgi:hypothetical protein